MQVFAIAQMVSDRTVAALKLHIADLALAELAIRTLVGPAVGITVLFTRLTSEDKDYWMCRGRADAALLLTAELSMDVLASVVH